MNLKYKVKGGGPHHKAAGSKLGIPTLSKEKRGNEMCISPPQIPSMRAFASAGCPGTLSNFKSSKKQIATIDLAGAVSFKSSGFLFNMADAERFCGTTKASHNGWNMVGTSQFLLKDSALTPGSLFRGTFMNNYESTGFLKRA